MKQLPSRLRRLDDALADLPLDEPMLLTELDGYLTGVLLCPEAIPPAEWMQGIWGIDDGGEPAFEDPLDVQWFADAVMAHYGVIARDVGRGKPQPFFDIDERNGDVLWEAWIDGFAEAMALRPERWAAIAEGDDRDVADACATLSLLIAIARNESALDSLEIDAVEDHAQADLINAIVRLHAAHLREGGGAGLLPTVPKPAVKIGRNELCSCGSGKKSKRCCG
jgi:uncharacterized protein